MDETKTSRREKREQKGAKRGAKRAAKADKPNAGRDRRKYIAMRLEELTAERAKLMEERKALTTKRRAEGGGAKKAKRANKKVKAEA